MICRECAPMFRGSAMDADVQGCGLQVDMIMSWFKN